MALAFRLALMLTRCACSSGAHVSPVAHAHLAPILNRYSVSTGANAHPVPMFAWCPVSTGAPFRLAPTPTRCPCLPASLVSPGGSYPLVAHAWPDVYARLALMLRPVPMFARRSCSPDVHVSPNVHAHLRLMLHPMLRGDRSGTYHARTLEINPPWQETCNMHDFGTPDTK